MHKTKYNQAITVTKEIEAVVNYGTLFPHRNILIIAIHSVKKHNYKMGER